MSGSNKDDKRSNDEFKKRLEKIVGKGNVSKENIEAKKKLKEELESLAEDSTLRMDTQEKNSNLSPKKVWENTKKKFKDSRLYRRIKTRIEATKEHKKSQCLYASLKNSSSKPIKYVGTEISLLCNLPSDLKLLWTKFDHNMKSVEKLKNNVLNNQLEKIEKFKDELVVQLNDFVKPIIDKLLSVASYLRDRDENSDEAQKVLDCIQTEKYRELTRPFIDMPKTMTPLKNTDKNKILKEAKSLVKLAFEKSANGQDLGLCKMRSTEYSPVLYVKGDESATAYVTRFEQTKQRNTKLSNTYLQELAYAFAYGISLCKVKEKERNDWLRDIDGLLK